MAANNQTAERLSEQLASTLNRDGGGGRSPEEHVATRLLRTLQAIPDAVLSTDASGNIEYMNPARR